MADAKEVKVPDIGDFEDVPVIEVLVSEGDEVSENDPLVTLESDKATMDVPAPFAGKVAELKVSVDDKVSEGTVVLTIEAGDGDDEEEGEGEEEKPSGDGDEEPDEDGDEEEGDGEPADSDGDAEEEDADEKGSGEDEGDEDEDQDEDEQEDEDAEDKDEDEQEDEDQGEDAEPEDGDEGAEAQPSDAEASGDSGAAIYASPSVRRLARELDVDLEGVQGTGRKNRITKDDVKKAKEAPADEGAGKAGGGIPGLELAPWPDIDFEQYGEVERVQLSRIKRISGPALSRNWVMIPHVTHDDEADITDLEAFRKQINSEQDVKVTMVALLIKACVGSLRQFPEFNSSLDGDELVIKRYHHIGFAADTPQGLLVPVVRDADRKGLLEIASELRELSGKAREGKITAEEMRGGTFTISSLGGIGGTGFTPIVNAPEVAILGVTRSKTQPVWNGSEFVPRLMLPLSLSYDHRVIDGAAAARFVAHLASELADLRRVLL